MRLIKLLAPAILLVSVISCATGNQKAIEGPDVIIYLSAPDRGGAFFQEKNLLIKYPDTKGWRIISPEDWALIMQHIAELRGELDGRLF